MHWGGHNRRRTFLYPVCVETAHKTSMLPVGHSNGPAPSLIRNASPSNAFSCSAPRARMAPQSPTHAKAPSSGLRTGLPAVCFFSLIRCDDSAPLHWLGGSLVPVYIFVCHSFQSALCPVLWGPSEGIWHIMFCARPRHLCNGCRLLFSNSPPHA